MKIEFVDLKRQLYGDSFNNKQGIIEEINKNIEECVKNTSFTLGHFLKKFEKEFSNYCSKKYCIGLNSGTDALEFALRGYNIKDGNVITVPNSYFTTSSSINQVGATPKFIDVDKYTFNIDVNEIEENIDKETKAIIPVHIYGRPADMDRIINIANKHNLKIIEDCCHAHGALYKGKKVPISETGVFSFFPSKNLGAWGDGGAIVTNNKDIDEKVRLLRNDGSLEKYVHTIHGRKARLDGLQAAVLSVKLNYLDKWNKSRRELAVHYNEKLKNIKELQLPIINNKNINHVFHLYTIFTDKRDELASYLDNKGISTGVHYPTPIHLQKAYNYLGFKKGSFPVAEELSKKELSLPMFPELREDEINYICDKIKTFFRYK